MNVSMRAWAANEWNQLPNSRLFAVTKNFQVKVIMSNVTIEKKTRKMVGRSADIGFNTTELLSQQRCPKKCKAMTLVLQKKTNNYNIL